MKSQNNKMCFAIILSLTLVASICLLVACNNQQATQWDLTSDGSVSASFSDNGHYGFILTISGNGEMPDYDSPKDTPWYSKSGRVTDIVIDEGITYIGNNSFTNCAAELIVVAKSVKGIGNNAFSPKAVVCAYNDIPSGEGVSLYMYSEQKPTESGNFWYLKDGKPCVWDTLKVLFVGNSFTYYSDIPKLFENIANSAGEDVVVDSVTKGAWTLDKFADANDEYGKIVDQKLKNTQYDVVVLQEQSTRPIDNYQAFLDGAIKLKQKIDATQTDCQIYLYATWGYQEAADNLNKSIPEVEQSIRTAYDKVAKQLSVEVCYVGKAFSTVYSQYPELNLYYTDNKHPSYQGAFLSACVHVATILNCDPTQAEFVGELDQNTAALIKQIAKQSVFGTNN